MRSSILPAQTFVKPKFRNCLGGRRSAVVGISEFRLISQATAARDRSLQLSSLVGPIRQWRRAAFRVARERFGVTGVFWDAQDE